MAPDLTADVRRYAADAEEAIVAGIARHCGAALANPESAVVNLADSGESARVRDAFLRKKLGLVHPDGDLDAAIAAVGTRLGGEVPPQRVTAYYLLAERFGLLDMFRRGASKGASKGVGGTPAGGSAKLASLIDRDRPRPADGPGFDYERRSVEELATGEITRVATDAPEEPRAEAADIAPAAEAATVLPVSGDFSPGRSNRIWWLLGLAAAAALLAALMLAR